MIWLYNAVVNVVVVAVAVADNRCARFYFWTAERTGSSKKTDKTFLSDVAILLFKRLNGEKFGRLHFVGVFDKKKST